MTKPTIANSVVPGTKITELIQLVKHNKLEEIKQAFAELSLPIEGINTNGPWGTALFCAVNNGHVEIAKYLLEIGADPSVPDSTLGRNILHEAVTMCYLDMVEMLKKTLKPEIWNVLLEQKSGSIDKRATPVGLAPKFSEFPELVALLRPFPMRTTSFPRLGGR